MGIPSTLEFPKKSNGRLQSQENFQTICLNMLKEHRYSEPFHLYRTTLRLVLIILCKGSSNRIGTGIILVIDLASLLDCHNISCRVCKFRLWILKWPEVLLDSQSVFLLRIFFTKSKYPTFRQKISMDNQVGLQGWFPQNIERFHRLGSHMTNLYNLTLRLMHAIYW